MVSTALTFTKMKMTNSRPSSPPWSYPSISQWTFVDTPSFSYNNLDLTIDVDIRMAAASGCDSGREVLPKSSMAEGNRYQHRSWSDPYHLTNDSGNDAILMFTPTPFSLSAERVGQKEEGDERRLHLGSSRVRALRIPNNGNEYEDDDSRNRNKDNIGNSGGEESENSGDRGRNGNLNSIGNVRDIGSDDGIVEDRDFDGAGDEQAEDHEEDQDLDRIRTRRELKRAHENNNDSDGGGNDRRRKKKRRILVKPILCINGDAKVSHHLWVYCALCSLAVVRGTQRLTSLTREEHKHGDSFGSPLGHNADPGESQCQLWFLLEDGDAEITHPLRNYHSMNPVSPINSITNVLRPVC